MLTIIDIIVLKLAAESLVKYANILCFNTIIPRISRWALHLTIFIRPPTSVPHKGHANITNDE